LKPIKIENITEFETNIIAYNILNLKNKDIMIDYENFKKSNSIKSNTMNIVKKILSLYLKQNNAYNDLNLSVNENDHIRRIISNIG
jgi:hypothetical protein